MGYLTVYDFGQFYDQFHRSLCMAKKKKVADGAVRGVPTLEIVHEVREKKELPSFMLVGMNLDLDCDDEEYEDDDQYMYRQMVDGIESFHQTEEEAIAEATKKLKSSRYRAEYRIFHATRAIRSAVAEPVVEVLVSG
jgi:hypothetical protein